MTGYEAGGEAEPIEGGWFPTGDVLRREDDGSYTYLRRAGDRFKAGGLWVEAGRVSDALLACRGVAAAVALPVRDRDGLTRVGAAVVPEPAAPEPQPARLVAEAAGRLAPHELPRALLVLTALPTTASGKIDRARLGRLLADELPARARAGRGAG
jgi:acyl-coenzyme A synthetase/AMP-(fatty) acid ligase